MKVGVLALQGDVREHFSILEKIALPRKVLYKEDFKDLDALVIPGGESTTITKLMKEYGIDEEIIKFYKKGKLIYGTCAGAIILANKVIGKQESLGLIDVEIERNAYGRQIDSFEALIDIKYIGKFPGVFIRAPIIRKVCKGDILAYYNNSPVMVRQDNVLVTTFHSELGNDSRVHEYWLNMKG